MAKTDVNGLSIEDLILALKAATGNDDESLKKRAEYEAEAHKRLNKRENEQHPGLSVYSNPKGDVLDPKPDLKCKMFWVGYDLRTDTLTPEEVRLLNLAKPGMFQFKKTDGAVETITITGKQTADGSLERLEFHFPCRGDNRHNLPSMVSLLREISQEPSEADHLRQQLAALERELERATEPSHA